MNACRCHSIRSFRPGFSGECIVAYRPRRPTLESAGRRRIWQIHGLDLQIMPTVDAFGPLIPEFEPEPRGARHSGRRCGYQRCSSHASCQPHDSPSLTSPTGSLAGRSFDDTGEQQGPGLRMVRPSFFTALSSLMILSGVFFCPATAATVPFENCLPETYVQNVPPRLQWVPKWVDASFETTGSKHALRVTMWGNVTGSFTGAELPPPESPHWEDPDETEGKIVAQPQPDVPSPKLTTLRSQVEVLTYKPWRNGTNFCDSLINASCPLAPVFVEANSR